MPPPPLLDCTSPRWRGRHTTIAEYLPKAHQQHLEWSPSRILGWAERVGPHTRALAAGVRSYRHVDAILKHGLDRVPLPTQQRLALPEVEAHEHLRGPAYYQTM